jgi:cytochrome c2
VTVFYLKALLSLALLPPVVYCMYSMFQIFGGAVAENVSPTKLRHKISGYVALTIVLLISYLCAGFAAAAKAEPSPRAAVHIALALSVLTLFAVKVLFVRQFYSQAKAFGLAIGIMSIVMIGISGGYYLAMTRFGQDLSADKSVSYRLKLPFLTIARTDGPASAAIRTDRASIGRGGTIFAARCAACHDPLSAKTIVGPGLKGLLKAPTLPKSGHPATAESIRFQLRQPTGSMPSFASLSEDEMENLIAYLNTL